VVRQRLPSENTLGPVTLMGDKAWTMFVSPISALAQKLCRRLSLKSNAVHTARVRADRKLWTH
jgi:hypothetical protein